MRAEYSSLDVVAFAGATTPYAKIMRRTPWNLPEGRSAQLVTIQDVRGVLAVSKALGLAVRVFAKGRGIYPAGTTVERLP